MKTTVQKKITTLSLLITIFIFSLNISHSQQPPKNQISIDLGNGNIIELVYINSGQFQMIAEEGKPGRLINISNGFWIGKYEVTQFQWLAVMGNNPSRWIGYDLPVENVSWNDTMEFCKKLSEKIGKKISPPTEDQWEYVYQTGLKQSAEINLADEAWYKDNAEGRTHLVGQKQPNARGLYDLLGNVWEWCLDSCSKESLSQKNDLDSYKKDYRVFRGGCWFNSKKVILAPRFYDEPSYKSPCIGFRIVVNE